MRYFNTKYMPCKYCEVDIEVTSRQRRPIWHPECAEKAMRDNINQMATKSGPNYKKWAEAMAKFAEELTPGG